MVTSSNMDALKALLNAESYDSEQAREIAGDCLDSGGPIGKYDSFVVSPSPDLLKALRELFNARSVYDSKLAAQRVIDLAEQEL